MLDKHMTAADRLAERIKAEKAENAKKAVAGEAKARTDALKPGLTPKPEAVAKSRV